MNPTELQKSLQQAVEIHRLGRVDEAEALYRQIIASDPYNADALHLTGFIAYQKHQYGPAVELFRKAIAFNPNAANYHCSMGMAYFQMRQLTASVAELRTAIRLDPKLADAHFNLGVAMQAQNQLDAAIDSYQNTLRIQPGYLDATRNLAPLLQQRGNLQEAMAVLIAGLKENPNIHQFWNDIGNYHCELGQKDKGILAYQKAIALCPNYGQAFCNLANVYKDQGQLDAAIDNYRTALKYCPEISAVHNNLGNALAEQGLLDDALNCYRRAVSLDPSNPVVHDSLLLTMHYHPDVTGEQIAAEHAIWRQRHADPLRKFIRPHRNSPDPNRRLRIGYVSGDLFDHAAARFLLPLLKLHNRQQFQISCYAQVAVGDDMTRRLHAVADMWRRITGLSDRQLADLIRQDGIDILVDLSSHSGGSRLLALAMQPAPVQVSYLAYCSTTGLDTIAYRLSDRYLDPPDRNPAYYSEKTVRLPHSYWCYLPDNQPFTENNALPAASAGYVTFGSMNNFVKVTPATLELWRQLLAGVPNSRLVMYTKVGSHRQRILDFFAQSGIEPQRIELVSRLGRDQYFLMYRRIDIALDPFPYAGGTTTCDALWMGVPVVTLAGDVAVSRGGLSILSTIGLQEWAAASKEQYLSIATSLAGEIPRLAEIRRTLRQRMMQSPLMDAPTFTRDIEQAFRTMWQQWCAAQPSVPTVG